MMRKLLFTLCLFASLGAAAQSPTYNDQVLAYISSYKSLAIAEQQRSGVPAAITLAQGIHETMAGQSELATLANNHFGIKCKKEWTGETFAHDDDAPQECFRKYGKAEDSYRDHSTYLKTSKRYASCFALTPTNYAGWASELRKCGYATNPQYSQRLIKIIEDYNLQEYTYAALSTKTDGPVLASAASPVAAVMMSERLAETAADKDTPKPVVSIDNTQRAWGKVTVQNGVKGFWAHKGEVLLEYAIQAKVRYAKLLEMNALPDAPLAEDRFIYLEKGGAVMPASATAPVSPVVASTAPVTSSDAYVPTAKVNVAAPEVTVAVPPPSATHTQAVVEKPVVVKIEEEVKPVQSSGMVVTEEVPQDAFSRMKAQMDKVVYAPERKPVAAKQPMTPVAMMSSDASATTTTASYHTVAPGETAFGISKKYGITMKQLMDWNKLDFSAIKIGQKLRVK